MMKWINKKGNKKGFTLVELVVVIAILGILAAIAIPKMGTFRKDAEIKATIATARTIVSAVGMLQANDGYSEEPKMADLGDHLNNATALGTEGYEVEYSSVEGEVKHITVPEIDGNNKWVIGENKLSK